LFKFLIYTTQESQWFTGTAPQIRSTILALYKLVCMYVCTEHLI